MRTYTFGPRIVENGVAFVWYAPLAEAAFLRYGSKSLEHCIAMNREADGRFCVTVEGIGAGTYYGFQIAGNEQIFPDIATRLQTEGVHGPSCVVEDTFVWPKTEYIPRPWHEQVVYELHIGTFTPEGTYRAAVKKLDHVAATGITAIELMPLADSPGDINWGYDGVYMYAPEEVYGSADDLKHFIAEAHARNIAVILDVVYNHFGPEGNYLGQYAPIFFEDRDKTPWGNAINYSIHSAPLVREFFIENALYWLDEFRFDGLRFDAVHTIYDESPKQILTELQERVRTSFTRTIYLVIEDDANNIDRFSGYDARWNDDAHHALHSILTKEHDGYYADYMKEPHVQLARALTSGLAYQGAVSLHRGGIRHGEVSSKKPFSFFVNFLQNHDQIGNRAFGERLTVLAKPQAVEAALALLLLSPPIPMLFMGEEWGAETPFLFFVDFEPHLAASVREGRREAFKAFKAFDQTHKDIPDPTNLGSFEASRLMWSDLQQPQHHARLELVTALLHLRRKEISSIFTPLTGDTATYQIFGTTGIRARWKAPHATLLLETNLSNAILRGTDLLSEARTIYTTHAVHPDDTVLPPWFVRWSIV